jgi:phenylacetate-CoA ligase
VVFPSQIEEVLVGFDEVGNNFCMVVENVSNLDRLTLQVEIRELAELTDDARERLSKRIGAATRTTVGVSPRVELHEPFSLPR